MSGLDRRDAVCPARAGGVAHAREGIDMAEPLPVKVTRYRCPHCPRTASSKSRMRDHIGRCWRNPEVKGCKTCRHFLAYAAEYGDDCAVGVDLSGNPPCERCGGDGLIAFGGQCPDCAGEPMRRPGPIVGCDRWSARGPEQP